MSEQKAQFPLPDGRTLEGVEVQIKDSKENWSEIQLEDGTILRFKTIPTGAIRIDKEFDPMGNPLYFLKSTIVTNVVSVPEHLRRPK